MEHSGSRAAGTSKGAQKRTELLDAAEEILLTSGYAELSMRAVATAAGVRLGHLQYYFPSRADLVAAVLNRALDRSMARLEPLLTGDRTVDCPEPVDVVRMLLAEQDDTCVIRLFTELWALAALDDTVAEAVRSFYRAYQDQVAAFLQHQQPDLPIETCQARAAVFTMLIEGAALFRSGVAAHRSPATDDELIAFATGLLGATNP